MPIVLSAPRAQSCYTTRPRIPEAHVFEAGGRPMFLSVDDGAIFEADPMMAGLVGQAMDFGDSDRARHLLAIARGIRLAPVKAAPVPASVPVKALSLAIAQKCNLGCTYCYAQQGSFGGSEKNMTTEVARQSVDLLINNAQPGEKVSLTYLGGEPLVNRPLLQEVTEYAAGAAASAQVGIAFSLTTNATLLKEEDAAFFNRYRFSVTISVDGTGADHDALRPFKSGAGSYQRVMANASRLLAARPRHFAARARVTVTPGNLEVPQILASLVAMGFDGVQLSPMLSSPNGRHEMQENHLASLLNSMIACGRTFQEHLAVGKIYPFTNLINMLQRIHRNARDEYPCGAGGNYMGVSSEGGLYACHRFVGEEEAAMGNTTAGVDPERQGEWLQTRNVFTQEPCTTCWARHLCGGGCHHEVIHRGRPACDYIRGWTHYCLGVYAELLRLNSPLLHEVLGIGTRLQAQAQTEA